jgi:hypothetical protein
MSNLSSNHSTLSYPAPTAMPSESVTMKMPAIRAPRRSWIAAAGSGTTPSRTSAM